MLCFVRQAESLYNLREGKTLYNTNNVICDRCVGMGKTCWGKAGTDEISKVGSGFGAEHIKLKSTRGNKKG